DLGKKTTLLAEYVEVALCEDPKEFVVVELAIISELQVPGVAKSKKIEDKRRLILAAESMIKLVIEVHEHQRHVMDVRFIKIVDLKVDNYKYENRVRNDKMKRISNRTVSDKAMQTKNEVIPMKSI
ncbi:29076_t:CDS:2, partial [Gigaspora margarita]